jgi:hypothetical protein
MLRIQIRMFSDLLDPEPDLLVQSMDPEPAPDPPSKNSKKNLISYNFVTSL